MVKSSRLVFTVPILVALGLTGCGTTPTSSPSNSSMPSSNQNVSTANNTTGKVTSILVNKSGEVLQASHQPSSLHHEATFILTALSSNGKPAVHEPVNFFIGPMKPLSGIPPKAWYESGTSQSKSYIASASHITNSKGQATIVLYGQPADTMEMIGAQVGNLSSYDVKAMHSIAGLDAWWTSSAIKATAPIGNTITLNPWISVASGTSSQPITVSINSPSPFNASKVTFIVKGTANSSSSSNSMGTSSMSSGLTQVKSIQGNGSTTFHITLPKQSNIVPLRVVITNQKTNQRFAGGVNAEIITK